MALPVTEKSSELRSVVVEREVAFPPEKIWRALTQPLLIEDWLMKNDFKPSVGHRFKFEKSPQPDINVVIDCKVLKVEPNRTLSYTWEAFGLESIVTWTLTPTATGTHLRMEQWGFPPDQKAAYKGAKASWPAFLADLEAVLARLD